MVDLPQYMRYVITMASATQINTHSTLKYIQLGINTKTVCKMNEKKLNEHLTKQGRMNFF